MNGSKFKILRERYSSRGGGIEIDLTPFGYEGEKMSVYQNYLGGGMLGSIQTNNTIEASSSFIDPDLIAELKKISDELKLVYFERSGQDEGELSFEQLQKFPTSSY